MAAAVGILAWLLLVRFLVRVRKRWVATFNRAVTPSTASTGSRAVGGDLRATPSPGGNHG